MYQSLLQLVFELRDGRLEAVLIGELAFRPWRLGAIALHFSCCLVGQSAYSADQACAKWFERNAKKIQSNCELDCVTFGTDMGTYHCLNACEDLCSELGNGAASRPGRFLRYPGLTIAERKLVDQNPKEAIVVFVQKTRAEMSSTRNFPVQGFNDESDAFRHYIWAGLLVKEIGAERAQLYLNAHEENRLQRLPERDMDMANNQIGILAAQKLMEENKEFDLKLLAQSALNDLRAHRLVILNPGLSIPKEPL